MALSDEIMMFIDTSKCIGCRACQVACKQWHSLSAENTSFVGVYTNPPDFSGNTLTFVRYKEYTKDAGSVYETPQFLFLKDQCRHCYRPKCQRACPAGVHKTVEGFVIFNEACTNTNMRLRKKKVGQSWVTMSFADHCPYNVPRLNNSLGRYVKCDFCYDRFNRHDITLDGSDKHTTACELACPTNAIVTGSYDTITTAAKARYRVVKSDYPLANIYPGRYGRTNVIYLLTDLPSQYGLPAGLP